MISRTDPGRLITEPLVHADVPIGSLVMATRGRGGRFAPAEHRLLQDLGNQVASALHQERLDHELRASRERLVLAREEERRMLRRTLHDDVGPTMAAIPLRTETVRRLLATQTPAVAEVLDRIERDATRAAETVRQLAYDLRPPVLDELGLIAALEQHILALAPLVVHLEADGVRSGQPSLAAAVEVAAYRVVSAALDNAARHAGAQACWVSLRFARWCAPDRGGRRRRRPAGRLPRRGGNHCHARASRRTRRTTAPWRPGTAGAPWCARACRWAGRQHERESIPVLVVDDHPLYREGLVGLLDTTDDLVVVGQAGDGLEAVRLAAELAPDVVVMDVTMPGLDGIEATRRIVSAATRVRVLVLSMLDDASVADAIAAGAHGYVVKSSTPDAGAGRHPLGRSRGLHLLGIPGCPARRDGRWWPEPGAVRRTDHTRARGARAAREGLGQPPNRSTTRSRGQNSPQPRVDHPGQAAGRRSRSRDREGEAGRAGLSLTRGWFACSPPTRYGVP